jgi:NTE family protein
VLAGGAARGAYEVGVLRYLIEDVAQAIGHPVPLDILCGTSVGAINVCALAAFADDPRDGVERLVRHWRDLRVQQMVRPDGREALAMLRGLWGGSVSGARRGGLLNPEALERLVGSAIPFARIDDHLRAGRLQALTVSATHVATGRTVVFIQRDEPGLPPWSQDPTVLPLPARIRAPHALASAAIPFMFPAVTIDGARYCDGGLRQNVPLSPARRLGAERMVVVNPHYLPDHRADLEQEREDHFPDPLFLLGKTLNALLLDRIDNDISRLSSINAILDAGTRRYGPDFVAQLNEELGRAPERGIRPLRTVMVRASEDIGRLAAAFVRSPRFDGRVGGVLGRVLRHLAEAPEADFLSYLLFDGHFADELITLGYEDARARHEDLCALFRPPD